jgi:hypothetical protein
MSKGFRSRKRIGDLVNSTAVDKRRGVHEFYPGSAPRRVKTYILLVWSCIAGIYGAVTKVRRYNLAEVEGDGVASLCVFACLGGRPWWLYICSQLGFTGNFFLLLQVEVPGLAGFMYLSSGLLPWQEPGRQISRTEGPYPRQWHCWGFCSPRTFYVLHPACQWRLLVFPRAKYFLEWSLSALAHPAIPSIPLTPWVPSYMVPEL